MNQEERVTQSLETNRRAITIKKARDILGEAGKNYSDERLQEVLDVFYGITTGVYEDFMKL